jgi:hypothetical protein
MLSFTQCDLFFSWPSKPVWSFLFSQPIVWTLINSFPSCNWAPWSKYVFHVYWRNPLIVFQRIAPSIILNFKSSNSVFLGFKLLGLWLFISIWNFLTGKWIDFWKNLNNIPIVKLYYNSLNLATTLNRHFCQFKL